MHTRALYRTCVAAATLAITLSGCSGGDPSSKAKDPAEIVAASAQAAAHCTGVLASGLVQDTGSTNVRVDLHIVPGEGAIGHLTYRWGPLSVYLLEVVRLGENIYFQAIEQSFYEQIAGKKVEPSLVGKWVRASVNSTSLIRTLSSYTELPNLTRSFFDQHGKLSLGVVTRAIGTTVAEVNNDSTGEVLYVNDVGRPFPMQIIKAGADTNLGIVFDEWDAPRPITVPAGAIDIEALRAKT